MWSSAEFHQQQHHGGGGGDDDDNDFPLRREHSHPHQHHHSHPLNSISGTAPVIRMSQWAPDLSLSPSPSLPGLADSRASVPAPVLLCRSIRDPTHRRASVGTSREPSNRTAHSGDDNEDSRHLGEEAVPSELSPRLVRAATTTSVYTGTASPNASSTTCHTPVATAAGAAGGDMPTNFEALWNNIDRYLFAVYTTLQTGDESTLRPLRAPRHRMGWYTVIYNACSGDPAKSRELYARLALLLLHTLESHVLFPILQNLDHNRVHILTGSEEDASTAAAAVRSSSSSSGWSRLRSLATGTTSGGGGTAASAPAGASPLVAAGAQTARLSREASINASFHSPRGASNSSFAFMKRIFHPSATTSSHPPPAATSANQSLAAGADSVRDDKRQPQPAGAPMTPGSARGGTPLAAGSGVGAVGGSGKPSSRTSSWFGQQTNRGRWAGAASTATGPNTPTLLPVGRTSTTSFGPRENTVTGTPGSSSPTSTLGGGDLHSAFVGVDSGVNRSPVDGTHWCQTRIPTPLTAPSTAAPPPTTSSSSMSRLQHPAAHSGRGLTISVGPSSHTSVSSPFAPAHQQLRSPTTSNSGLSRHSTQIVGGAHTAASGFSSSSRTQSPTSTPYAATATAPLSAIAAVRHARVASKTGRVLVDDEEEVLCEANTVAPAAERRRTLRSSDTSSVAEFASFNDTEEATERHPRDAAGDGRDMSSSSSLHTMHSSLSSLNSAPAHLRAARRLNDDANSTATAPDGSSPAPLTRDLTRADEVDGAREATVEGSANFFSPATATLTPGGDDALSIETSVSMGQAAPDTGTTSSAATTALPPPPVLSATASASMAFEESCIAHARAASEVPAMLTSGDTRGTSPVAGEGASATVSTTASFDASAAASTSVSGARPHSTQDRFGECTSQSVTEAATTTTSPTPPVPDISGSVPTEARRLSLCYTFIQEWQTFLVFRGVVLSCFRYLDQYYTRRFGMDTITLMCFKVFHVVVYEPLHPLLLTELRFLTQYVREVFESTGQVAWEQVEMIQEVYRIITELLLLVQSTSSSMVAQQQQQQQPRAQGSGSAGAAGGTTTGVSNISGGGVTGGAAAAAAAAPLTSPHMVPSTVAVPSAADAGHHYSRPSSAARSTASARRDSTASSAAGTPHVAPLDGHSSATASPLGVLHPAETTRTSGGGGGASFASASPSSPHVSKRQRLISLFSGSRTSSQAAATSGSIPASPLATPQPARGAGRVFVFDLEGGSGEVETPGPVDTSPPVQADVTAAIVVSLRGMVELRERLGGHTSGHHLTTQALKQWEGMAADRRLRIGTIIKEMAAPLLTTVMEDVGNDYVSGIYAFYRYACAAHRGTEAGRRSYVEWAGAVKELEGRVWRRVRLPFLHAALRSALNDVLVVGPHRPILLDHQFGLRAMLDEWSASVVAAELTLVPQASSSAAASGNAPRSAARGQPWKNSAFSSGGGGGRGVGAGENGNAGGVLSLDPSSATEGLSRGPSKYLESPIAIGFHGSHQHHLSSYPHQRTSSSLSFEVSWSAAVTTPPPPPPLTVAASDNAFRSGAESDRRVGRTGVGASAAHGDAGPVGGSAGPTAIRRGSSPSAPGVSSRVEGPDLGATLRALESLFSLFNDVTSDECFVLMAVVLVQKLIHDAAHLFEQYLKAVSVPPPAAAAPANQAAPGVALISGLVSLLERYSDLVERVFRNNATVRRAAADAVEEIVRPARWTRKAALQASQRRAHEALMSAGAGVVGGGGGDSGGVRLDGAAAAAAAVAAAASSSVGAGLPSVFLSRDARQATLPLTALSAEFPEAVAQLRLSVLLARYADTFLQQQARGAGRVLSAEVVKRLSLVARLVSRLDDKDTFLEHYRLCLARRLLGFSSPSAGSEGAGVEAGSTSLNIDAERQLVSFLQAYVGVAGTHAFEAMLRDYEGTERTRELFEGEPGYRALPARIRVQLITSAQWPTYTMPPLQPHASLQCGMDVFRAHYAKLHPSRTLLWVFSLGTATLNVELVGGSKQVVASTLLATLLLAVSDAYNTASGGGVVTGTELARKTGLPFHALRNHLHLLTQNRAFSLLRCVPARGDTNPATAGLQEVDTFTLNPIFTHRLRKIRLPLPKARPTGLPLTGDGAASAVDAALDGSGEGPVQATSAASAAVAALSSGAGVGSEEAVVVRHVSATRRVLLDAAIVRIFKSRRVVAFEDLLQTVTAQLARQFTPSRRDVKAQLEGLIDRDYVRRSPDDPNTFVYVS